MTDWCGLLCFEGRAILKSGTRACHAESELFFEVVSALVVLLTLLGLTLRQFSDGDYTFVVTAGAGFQCLGFWLLLQKVRGGSEERA